MNREQIEQHDIEDFRIGMRKLYAIALHGKKVQIPLNEIDALCDLALSALQPQGEPVAWCVGYDDPRFGLIPSNPTMCKEDAEMTIKKAGGKLRLIALTYADAAPPADGVAVTVSEGEAEKLLREAKRLRDRINSANDLHAVFTIKDSAEFSDCSKAIDAYLKGKP